MYVSVLMLKVLRKLIERVFFDRVDRGSTVRLSYLFFVDDGLQ